MVKSKISKIEVSDDTISTKNYLILMQRIVNELAAKCSYISIKFNLSKDPVDYSKIRKVYPNFIPNIENAAHIKYYYPEKNKAFNLRFNSNQFTFYDVEVKKKFLPKIAKQINVLINTHEFDTKIELIFNRKKTIYNTKDIKKLMNGFEGFLVDLNIYKSSNKLPGKVTSYDENVLDELKVKFRTQQPFSMKDFRYLNFVKSACLKDANFNQNLEFQKQHGLKEFFRLKGVCKNFIIDDESKQFSAADYYNKDIWTNITQHLWDFEKSNIEPSLPTYETKPSLYKKLISKIHDVKI